ncbi:GNAT family N-acetyltransferase [Guptibacillus algicola]|uniref:GNAT family N-acetyltransferase n=1 Tax=Guptibacillus algicola TaxID=225844 RepID=UPI001CD5D501|nr:GNAT family N-acetyltransferase [Alkalihalobacillus algicola]MCA0988503.1 GNAT family N-acetyltransferase [Alkalihalobacillus algicola]
MITLREMTQKDFEDYLAFMIPDYSRDISTNFNVPPKKALEESQTFFEETFPDGVATKGHYLYLVHDAITESRVGLLWFNVNEETRHAYLYHIYIDEQFRGKGYGSKTLMKCEEVVREMGISSLGLSVFGNNDRAIQLYQKNGYQPSSISMKKNL